MARVGLRPLASRHHPASRRLHGEVETGAGQGVLQVPREGLLDGLLVVGLLITRSPRVETRWASGLFKEKRTCSHSQKGDVRRNKMKTRKDP